MVLSGVEREIGGTFEAGLDDAPPPAENQERSAGGGDGGLRGIRYRECLKNHAVTIGGNVTDGCGEFMPSGEEGTVASLKCAACSCHRSFHRKETPNGGNGGGAPPPTPPSLPSFASMTQRSNAWASLAAQSSKSPAAFGSGAATTTIPTATAAAGDSSFQEPNLNAQKCFFNSAPSAAETPAKKRFRTKFTAEQKDKMAEFAEKIGWRIPREEESINGVERFCGEIGVKRPVFKVWMHNNKSSAKSHLPSTASPSPSPSPSSSSSINN